MSSVYNPETETIAQIERLELEAREVRRKVEQARSETDRHVLERQLRELEDEVERLRARLP
jgi:predicted nuclease with TOPRIM domain